MLLTDLPNYNPDIFNQVSICAPYIAKKGEKIKQIGYFVTDYIARDFFKEFTFITNPYSYTIQKIDEFISLNNNWDGYGAIAITSLSGYNAKKFVFSLTEAQLESISDIFPNPHGTITIEWENSKGEKISLDIGESNYSYFVTYNNQTPILVDGKDIFSNIREITSEIDNLVGKEKTNAVS